MTVKTVVNNTSLVRPQQFISGLHKVRRAGVVEGMELATLLLQASAWFPARCSSKPLSKQSKAQTQR
jgi:hypothetical protein